MIPVHCVCWPAGAQSLCQAPVLPDHDTHERGGQARRRGRTILQALRTAAVRDRPPWVSARVLPNPVLPGCPCLPSRPYLLQSQSSVARSSPPKHKQWPDYNLCKSEGVRGQTGGRAAKQKLCRAVARSNGTAMSILQYFLRRGGEAAGELPSREKHAHSSRVSRAAAVTTTRLPFTSPAEQAIAVRIREVGRVACGVWPPWDDHGHILSSSGPEKGVG